MRRPLAEPENDSQEEMHFHNILARKLSITTVTATRRQEKKSEKAPRTPVQWFAATVNLRW
jgi:hypothetical protein